MKWITDRTPTNEQEILILTKRRYRGDDRYEIVRGFYTDGNTNTEDSDYCWIDTDDFEYDEENDAYIIPQGYWEDRWYGNGEDTAGVIDDRVVGWCRMKDALDEAIEQI